MYRVVKNPFLGARYTPLNPFYLYLLAFDLVVLKALIWLILKVVYCQGTGQLPPSIILIL